MLTESSAAGDWVDWQNAPAATNNAAARADTRVAGRCMRHSLQCWVAMLPRPSSFRQPTSGRLRRVLAGQHRSKLETSAMRLHRLASDLWLPDCGQLRDKSDPEHPHRFDDRIEAGVTALR